MRWSYFIVLLLTLAVLGWVALLAGSGVGSFLDIPSLLVVLVPALLMSLASYGLSEMGSYFALAFKKEGAAPVALEKGIHFFDTLQTYFKISAAIAFSMGLILILATLDDLSKIGPYLAVAVISVLYACVLALLLTVPFRTALEKKMIELGQ